VCKRNHVSSGGTANGGIGRCWGRRLNVQFPEFGGRCALALEDDSVVVTDGDGGLVKGYITTRIAQLSNGQKWLRGQVWDNVSMSGIRRKTRDV